MKKIVKIFLVVIVVSLVYGAFIEYSGALPIALFTDYPWLKSILLFIAGVGILYNFRRDRALEKDQKI